MYKDTAFDILSKPNSIIVGRNLDDFVVLLKWSLFDRALQKVFGR